MSGVLEPRGINQVDHSGRHGVATVVTPFNQVPDSSVLTHTVGGLERPPTKGRSGVGSMVRLHGRTLDAHAHQYAEKVVQCHCQILSIERMGRTHPLESLHSSGRFHPPNLVR
nr:MAG TPA: hypothetical protein [Caudoviricetes sp.]